MKKYEILRKDYFLTPNGDLMISNQILLNKNLSFKAKGIFTMMASMNCIGEELTDINIIKKGSEPLEKMQHFFKELIDKKYIKEVQ